MRSCLYRTVITHRRNAPVRHSFRHRVGVFLLDLDELEDCRWPGLFGVNRRGLVSFRDEDHVGGGSGRTREKFLAFLRNEGVPVEQPRIRLLTQCRMLGYVFNPISLYFVEEDRLRAVVAEVNNTFGERFLYVLRRERAWSRPGERRFRWRTDKVMHVSPFLDRNAHYEFAIAVPDERLSVSISEVEDGVSRLEATMRGRREPLTRQALLRLVATDPFLTYRITGAIHWQALRLWWKDVSWFRQPPPSEAQRRQEQQLRTVSPIGSGHQASAGEDGPDA